MTNRGHSDKRRILFVLHVPPPVHGASMVGQYIRDSAIINDAFECRYVNLSTSRSLDEIGKNPVAKVVRYASILRQVLTQLIGFKPDLCYVTLTAKGAGFYKDSLVPLLAKVFGVNLVYHFHNKGVTLRQHKRLDDMLYRTVFKHAHVILLSPRLYQDIEKYVPREKVRYCPSGVPELTGEHSKRPMRGEHQPVEILFLSNLIESKGVYVLLDSCKLLHRKGLPFRCTFVGGEGDVTARDLMAKVDNLGLGSWVHYAGPQYGLDKAAALARADILAFPTYYPGETFGLVNLEAMQFSVPVVSTPEAGIPDIVEDGKTGFLVPRKNPAALADRLERLIANPALRRQMGSAGRAKYEREFTLRAFEERMRAILAEIAG